MPIMALYVGIKIILSVWKRNWNKFILIPVNFEAISWKWSILYLYTILIKIRNWDFVFCYFAIVLGPETPYLPWSLYVDGQFVLSCSGNQSSNRKIINSNEKELSNVGSKFLYSLPFFWEIKKNQKMIPLIQNQNKECRIVKSKWVSCE